MPTFWRAVQYLLLSMIMAAGLLLLIGLWAASSEQMHEVSEVVLKLLTGLRR